MTCRPGRSSLSKDNNRKSRAGLKWISKLPFFSFVSTQSWVMCRRCRPSDWVLSRCCIWGKTPWSLAKSKSHNWTVWVIGGFVTCMLLPLWVKRFYLNFLRRLKEGDRGNLLPVLWVVTTNYQCETNQNLQIATNLPLFQYAHLLIFQFAR